jgi:DNA polymerase II small subunit/DNA polymerase delta subunit B
MDEDKRQQLDQQAEEYVDDVPEAPAMNVEPTAHHPDSGTAEPADSPEPTES